MSQFLCTVFDKVENMCEIEIVIRGILYVLITHIFIDKTDDEKMDECDIKHSFYK